ncbi:MAG: serine/threonine protein kinase [Polyangiaceae bacterium]|nr:serine/threonine protein kinase [Polyangiaceae bacterium]MCW5790790.1 serine/threonine protein kinase [Polyangiaceae bacterium]
MDELPERIGRYQIVRPLASGAMGRVLLAHDPVLDRPVAIKLLRSDLGLTPDQRATLLERMQQEARASARVTHPNIVALHDMGEAEGLGLYLVFEHVEGKNLKEQLEQGPLGPDAAAELALGLGAALAAAHAAGVLHRDIKPENIILAKHGPKLVDFGIARLPDSTLTHEGGVLGTPAYAAPEAIANGKFTPLSDQFSLATTLYEAISGRRAFPGDDAVAVASRIATEEPPTIAAVCGLDPHVDTVLARGMSKVPRSRFDSTEDLGRALAEALRLLPRTAIPTAPDRLHVEKAAGRGLRVGVGVVAGGAVIALGLLQVSGELSSRELTTASASAPVAIVTAAPESPDQPVAVLAERPPDRKKRPKTRIKRTDGSSAALDGGVEPEAGAPAAKAPSPEGSAAPPAPAAPAP